MLKRLAILFSLCFSFELYAQEPPVAASQLIARAQTLELAASAAWRKLLLYEASSTAKTGLASAIHSDDFFLAEQGRIDPEAELDATLAALLQPPTSVADEHPQCRFPARLLWLKQQLGFSQAEVTEVSCPQFEDWSFNGTTESVSIVFATGYLGNPASYYGHTLLKLNSKNQSKQTPLLDVSVNYGAIVPDNEGPVAYIFKGVLGGYSGAFSHIEYYFHTHNYGENELRDLWEYELKLPQEAVDLVVAHAWEVLGKKYTYYFFRRNCAYRMAELIEIIEGVEIIPATPLFTIPQSLIKKLSQATYQGAPLVETVNYHPSRQSRLYQRFNRLNAEQKALLEAVVAEPSLIETEYFTARTYSDQYPVLDTLLDYYQFIREPGASNDSSTDAPTDEAYRKVLSQRYGLPPAATVELRVPEKAPHDARSASLVSLGLVHSKERGEGAMIRVRPAYYDSLDADSAHVKNSSLAMADLSLFVQDQRIRVESFYLLNIESANTAVTGLPGDGSEAWRLSAGWERQTLSCRDCLVPTFEGAWGRAYRPHSAIDLTGLVGGGVQESRHQQGAAFASLTASALISVSQRFRLQLQASLNKPLDTRLGSRKKVGLNARYQLDKAHDLRLAYQKDDAEQWMLSIGRYW
ncbi:MAG: hypothetical protein ACJAWL_003492 [Motiliproteus sp.]